MDEKTTPFYKRREFKYLAIACIALIVTAIGAIFYNKHPRPSRPKRNQVVNEEARRAAPADTTTMADSISYEVKDTVHIAPDTILK